MAEAINVKFQLTTKRLYIRATYHDVVLSLNWPVDDENYARHINTLILNLPDMVKDGREEMFVRRESLGLDAELDHLFNQQDRGE